MEKIVNSFIWFGR